MKLSTHLSSIVKITNERSCTFTGTRAFVAEVERYVSAPTATWSMAWSLAGVASSNGCLLCVLCVVGLTGRSLVQRGSNECGFPECDRGDS